MKGRKKGLSRLLEIAGGKKKLLALSVILAALSSLLTLIPYILVYFIIKELTAPVVREDLIWKYIGWAAGAAVLCYLLLYASGIASHVAAFNILYELRKALADKISHLPLGFIQQRSIGAIKKILTDDVERIESFIAHQIPDFVKGMILPFLTIVYLFTVDWRLAAASLIPFVLVVILIPYSLIRKENKQLMKEYMDSQEKMNEVIIEFVRAMPVVKIFNQSVDAYERYRESVISFCDRVLYYLKKNMPANAVMISFISNNLLPVLAVGIWLYFEQKLELSTLLLFFILGVGYVKPLFALSTLGSQLYLVIQGVARMDEIFYAEEIPVTSTGEKPRDASIRFKDVSFRYQDSVTALDQVSFDIPAGSVTAFVGPSGAGKSTAAQLIARFWDVQEGQILIGGVDIRNIPMEKLYQMVSFVFQDSFLFHDTIYENIRMGMNVPREKVVAAAKAAQCHEFIERLPDGYDTRIGEGGVHLSGGEAQRIMLARVMLKNTPIIVLDEATAFADPDNEAKIQQAFSELMKGKTVIVIAHRLSTITNCDQIIVFHDSKVEAVGTHDELLNQSLLYKRMWQAHSRAKTFELRRA